MAGVCKALYREKNLQEIWRIHHDPGMEANDPRVMPPLPSKESRQGGVHYDPPGTLFRQVCQDTFHVMKVFLVSLEQCGLSPPRWHWETMLLIELNKLGPVTQDERDFAMLVCLVLSNATMDRRCIRCTVRLKEKGHLSVQGMLKASEEDVHAEVESAGFGGKTARALKEMAIVLVSEHDGKVPRSYEELVDLPGVGEKAGNIASNEILGNTRSIGCDRHVEDVSCCVGFHVAASWLKSSHPHHVEKSLRTWVDFGDYRAFNPVLGGMAQLTTSIHRTINTKEKASELETVMSAMADHIHRPCHVELLWFAIARIRHYYLITKKEEANARKEEAKARKGKKMVPKKASAKKPVAKPTRSSKGAKVAKPTRVSKRIEAAAKKKAPP